MSDEIENLPEMTELQPLEDHSELEELPAEAALHAAEAEDQPKSARGAQIGEKRQLEQAPILLRKASFILLIGSIFPWLVAFKWLTSETVGEPIAWPTLIAAKVFALLAFYVFHEGYKATHGGKTEGFVAKLADAHHVLVPAVAGVIAVVAFLIAAGIVPGLPLGGIDMTAALGEIGTLLLAAATFSHIFGYEHEGKFNPLFPLMFLGPGLAGFLTVFGFATAMERNSGMAAVGLVGDLLVAAGGLMAIYIMFIAMKQAKVEGDMKRAAHREARKAARAGQRAAR